MKQPEPHRELLGHQPRQEQPPAELSPRESSSEPSATAVLNQEDLSRIYAKLERQMDAINAAIAAPVFHFNFEGSPTAALSTPQATQASSQVLPAESTPPQPLGNSEGVEYPPGFDPTSPFNNSLGGISLH